jgi:hypothetical protein
MVRIDVTEKVFGAEFQAELIVRAKTTEWEDTRPIWERKPHDNAQGWEEDHIGPVGLCDVLGFHNVTGNPSRKYYDLTFKSEHTLAVVLTETVSGQDRHRTLI